MGTRSFRLPVSLIRKLLAAMALVPVVGFSLRAGTLPSGGQVVHGDVSITTAGGRMDVTQVGQMGIVNWSDFSVGAGSSVNIHQSVDAALLNRVTGANPSELLGQLNATGRVFLINPNGIVVGREASINAMEFIASALDVADQDFLNGDDIAFAGDSVAGVVNLGKITAANGDVILIAHRVANAGEITASEGVAALAAGNDVLLSPAGDQRILVRTSVTTAAATSSVDGTGVDNSGVIAAAQAELKAAGGNLYELAINQSGFIRATGVERRDGRVLLVSDGGTLAHSGVISAHDADGSGGEVLIGGDYRGQNPAVPNAEFTTITAGAVIDVAAAATHVDGGRVIVWADQQTDFAGNIEGRGGELGGDGAFAEVSGKRILNYHGLADLGATAGATGTLLLDPDQAIISDAADDQLNGLFNNSVLMANLATANVVVDASNYGDGDGFFVGDIIVNAPVTWTSGNTLTLKAGNRVDVRADLGGEAAGIEFLVTGANTFSSRFSVYQSFGSTVTADRLTIGQNPDAAFVGFNPLPEDRRSMGFISLQGAVRVGTLDIKLENRGIQNSREFNGEIDDAIFVYHENNAIGNLTTSVGGGYIDGSIVIWSGEGDLTVSADFSNTSPGAVTSIVTAGSLTLEGDARFAASTFVFSPGVDEDDIIYGGEVSLAARGGSFVNNATAAAATVALDSNSRLLLYSDDPANTVTGGLTGRRFYNAPYDDFSPRDVSDWEGDFIFYRFQPVLTFSADVSRTYGSATPALDFTVTGLLDGDDLALAFTGSPELSTTATSASGAGDYTINVEEGTVSFGEYGYGFAFEPGTLTITPASLTITADNKARTLGGANPPLTASFNGLVNGDLAGDIAGLILSTEADVDSPVGTYDIIASGAANANYVISFFNGILTVNAIPALSITADSFDIRYGAPLPTFTAQIIGFGPGDDESIVNGLTLTSSAVANSPVGTYDIIPANATAAGYEISYFNGTLTIDPALLTITAGSANRFYGAENPAFGVSYAGFVLGENESVLTGLDVTTTATAASNVGAYDITPSGATAANYAITFEPGTLTINPAPLTINIDNQSKIYADLNPSFTYTASGFVLGQSANDFDTFAPATTATQFSNVGDYAITASLTGALAANYDLTVNPGTLTINRRPGTVTIGSATREYGDTNPTIFVGVTGVAPVGTSNFYLNNVVRGPAITEAAPSSDVGVYPTTIADLTAANPNFDLTVVPGAITVTPAPLTLRANNTSRLYGADNPAFTGTTTGLKLSDTLADVLEGVSFTTAATLTSNVGGYPIVPGGTQISDNYAVTFTDGTLTVNRASLTITPALATRVYGDPDPTFTVVATGLRNGDTESVIQTLNFNSTNPTWGVGSYPLSIISATATNYSLTFTPGTLNVTPRPLTITANDFTREYGDPNPTFTASLDNLASFDTASVFTDLDFSTPATVTSNVIPGGGYGITVTSNANPNYAIGYEQGLLTITPAPLLVNLSNFTREYGDANPAPSVASIFGLKGTDTTTDLFLDYDVLPAQTADAGDYTYGAVSLNNNYTLETIDGRVTITPAPLTVGIGDVFRTYGDANPDTYTVQVDGLKFPAAPTDIVSVLNPTDATTGTGTYAFGAESLSGNYTITSVAGDIRINPRPLNLTFTNLTRRYGDTEFSQFALFDRVDLAGSISSFDNPFEVFTLSTGTNVASNVGTYPVSVNILNPNYMPGTVSGDLAITPRALTVVLDPLERVFGQNNPVNYDAFRDAGGDEDILPFDPLNTVLDITAPANTADVGNYTLTATLIDPNYTLNRFSGSMSVLPRPITLRLPDGYVRVYGDANPAVTGVDVLNPVGAETSGLAPFHEVDDVITFQLPDITADVGFYSFNTTLNPNYDATVIENGNVTIAARPITIGLPIFTRLYGDANPITTAVDLTPDNVSRGLASFDSIEDAAVVSLPDESADVGAYTVPWTAGPNYAVTIGSVGVITIDPRRLAISATPISARYGDGDVILPVGELTGESDGFASFDDTTERRREILLSFIPDETTPVGTYRVLRDSFPNYEIDLLFGDDTVTITPRPITVTLPGFTRLYGDANSADLLPTTADVLPTFQTLADVITINEAPSVTANVGVYPVTKTLNPNYTFTFAGVADYTIEQRVLDFGRAYRTYGDTGLVFSASAADGPASFDTLEGLLRPTLLGGFDLADPSLSAGYYALDGFGLTDPTNYRISPDSSSVFTVLPRLVSIDIADVNLTFDTAEEVRAYFANENLVLSATAAGLVNGDDFDDAFPIIRYQLVDEDVTPPLPVIPTINNVVLPTAESLIDNPSTSGRGVVLIGGAGGGAVALPRAKVGTLTTDGVVLQKFATVFDGFDTERNYVLGGVSNGSARIELKRTVVNTANSDIATGTYGLGDFKLTDNTLQQQITLAQRAGTSLTVMSGANPPGLLEFFTGGNTQFGVDMIMSFFEDAMLDGSLYGFAEGSLLAEITRSESGTLEDVTPFRVQRWLERNADNPAAMGLLAEPLASYTKAFLDKDPATHTASEAAFSRVLSLHMTKARDELAEQVKENHDAWVAAEVARGTNLIDLYGRDVPYGDFIADAGTSYVVQNVEAKIALVAGGTVAGTAATGTVIAGLATSILPYSAMKGALAGATAFSSAAVGAAVIPAAIAATAIVGSIARGVLVAENIEQQNTYNALVGGTGRTIDPSSFELTKASGKDDPINQTILLGALAGMLYP